MIRPGAILLALVLASAPGCGRVVFRPSGQTAANQALTLTPEQQTALAQQQQQYQLRAEQLDRDNQELESLLAQSRQETQLLRDHVAASQEELRAMGERLVASQQDASQLKERTQALVASTQQQVGATIRANNTLLRPLTVSSVPGVDVRQDGDVIRVAVPSDQLFAAGSARMAPGADGLIRTIATDLMQNYPEQMIGIEGHTDGAPVSTPEHPSSHHLSVAQATAVYDALRLSAGVPAQQLFVIGHGANHPRMSNGTEAGRQANRRIEVVVYPETFRR